MWFESSHEWVSLEQKAKQVHVVYPVRKMGVIDWLWDISRRDDDGQDDDDSEMWQDNLAALVMRILLKISDTF